MAWTITSMQTTLIDLRDGYLDQIGISQGSPHVRMSLIVGCWLWQVKMPLILLSKRHSIVFHGWWCSQRMSHGGWVGCYQEQLDGWIDSRLVFEENWNSMSWWEGGLYQLTSIFACVMDLEHILYYLTNFHQASASVYQQWQTYCLHASHSDPLKVQPSLRLYHILHMMIWAWFLQPLQERNLLHVAEVSTSENSATTMKQDTSGRLTRWLDWDMWWNSVKNVISNSPPEWLLVLKDLRTLFSRS